MQKDKDHIPDHIFGWIENKTYGSLSPSEKMEVSAYFTEEEYNDLYGVMALLTRPSAGQRREQLMDRFDRLHSSTKLIGLRSGHFDFLKAAAILVPPLSLAAFLILKDSGNGNLMSMTSARDTVYIEKTAATDTVVRHDTVYREIISEPELRPGPDRVVSVPVSSSDNLGTFDVLSLDQLDGTMNVSKGNSLKDDSLWLMFEAARL